VAEARLRGINLPPVQLIEVGGRYYVRDGHHRISVAQALGDTFIDAEVTRWQMR
jgi:ParB-like chromosome segregation protein Spo0J